MQLLPIVVVSKRYILFYKAIGMLKKEYNIIFGHQACFTIALGFIISYIMKIKHGDTMLQLIEFNDNIFFYACLPPLVFVSGFNMQRRKFFENITNIMLFGVVGTCTSFLIFGFFAVLITQISNPFEGNFIWQTNGATGVTTAVHLSVVEVL